jgi:hypothetical protein
VKTLEDLGAILHAAREIERELRGVEALPHYVLV